jgi:hypothetical protein
MLAPVIKHTFYRKCAGTTTMFGGSLLSGLVGTHIIPLLLSISTAKYLFIRLKRHAERVGVLVFQNATTRWDVVSCFCSRLHESEIKVTFPDQCQATSGDFVEEAGMKFFFTQNISRKSLKTSTHYRHRGRVQKLIRISQQRRQRGFEIAFGPLAPWLVCLAVIIFCKFTQCHSFNHAHSCPLLILPTRTFFWIIPKILTTRLPIICTYSSASITLYGDVTYNLPRSTARSTFL